jgi:hypothetical protein
MTHLVLKACRTLFSFGGINSLEGWSDGVYGVDGVWRDLSCPGSIPIRTILKSVLLNRMLVSRSYSRLLCVGRRKKTHTKDSNLCP